MSDGLYVRECARVRVHTWLLSLGRRTYVAVVLVLGYCIIICLETFDVTGVTNVATNALVGNLPAGVCDYVRPSAYALCAFRPLDERIVCVSSLVWH